MSEDVRVGDVTVRVSEKGVAQVVERRRKVGHVVLDCQYMCGWLDTDEPGHCWSAEHSGPRCAPVEDAPEAEEVRRDG